MFNTHKLQRLVIASALASGLVSIGVAASAQTTAAPSATATVSNATNVSMSTTSSKIDRKAELEQENAETRRIAFRHQGTSL